MSNKSVEQEELQYNIVVSQHRKRIELDAEPNRFVAHPRATIEWRDYLLRQELSVDVNWSCGGMTFDAANARKFFQAGLDLCDEVDRLVAMGEPKESADER